MKMLIGGLVAGLLFTGTAAYAHPSGHDGGHGWRGEQQARHWRHERREHERAEHWYRDRYYYYPAPATRYYYDYSYAPGAQVSGPGFYFSWTN